MGPLQGPAVGVDIGGTKLLAVRLNSRCRVEAEWQAASPRDGDELVDGVSEALRRVGPAEGGAVGVGVPALVDADGVIRFSPHLPLIAGTDLVAALRGSTAGTRLWVGNDSTAACWAEYVDGSARGFDDVLMVTLGTGIGGGMVWGGRIVEGANRFAGEIGHTVVDPSGPPCPCGKQGCWELYASGSALGGLGREAAMAGRSPRLVELAGGDAGAVRGEHVSAAAAGGDDAAAAVVSRYAWWLALGIANLVSVLDPAVVVAGGGVIEAGPVILGPVRRAFEALVEAPAARPAVPIVAAANGARAGAVGAALLAAAAV